MTRERHTITDSLFLQIHGCEEELDAVWEVTVETCPAEPTSWGADRGEEAETTARLISWHRHGQEYDRDEAVALAGETEIRRQEEIAAECFEPECAVWVGAAPESHGTMLPLAAE